MKSLLFIFVGGGLGSLFRFFISNFFETSKGNFPWSTLIANFFGCLLIGILLGWVLKNQTERSDLYLFAAVGFCGSLTTMSAFALDSSNLLESNQYISFIVNIFTNVGLSIAALIGGKSLMTAIINN